MLFYDDSVMRDTAEYLPEVSGELPCSNWNILPHAFATPAILAMMGRLCMTKETSFFWFLARAWACPSNPNPVTSVAPCALYLCINLAAVDRNVLLVMNNVYIDDHVLVIQQTNG